MSKFSRKELKQQQIVRLYENKKGVSFIAEKLGVTETYVGSVIRRGKLKRPSRKGTFVLLVEIIEKFPAVKVKKVVHRVYSEADPDRVLEITLNANKTISINGVSGTLNWWIDKLREVHG